MREERARNPQVNACQSGGRRGVGGEEGGILVLQKYSGWGYFSLGTRPAYIYIYTRIYIIWCGVTFIYNL